MEMKYAGSEILKMAVEIERKGKTFYEDMAKIIKDPRVKDIFKFLAEEEVRHEVVFTEMLSAVKVDDSYNEAELHQFFGSLVGNSIFPGRNSDKEMKKEMSNVSAALEKALALEKDAILFFHEMKTVTAAKDHAVIDKIIEEERDHIKRIIQLKKEYL